MSLISSKRTNSNFGYCLSGSFDVKVIESKCALLEVALTTPSDSSSHMQLLPHQKRISILEFSLQPISLEPNFELVLSAKNSKRLDYNVSKTVSYDYEATNSLYAKTVNLISPNIVTLLRACLKIKIGLRR